MGRRTFKFGLGFAPFFVLASCSSDGSRSSLFLDRSFASLCDAYHAAAHLAIDLHLTREARDFGAVRSKSIRSLAADWGESIPNEASMDTCEDIRALGEGKRRKDPDFSEADLYRSALAEFVVQLDPHSHYLSPTVASRSEMEKTNQSLGLGVTWHLQLADLFEPIQYLSVEEVFPDSPAWGTLSPNDRILAINGTPVSALGTGRTALQRIELLSQKEVQLTAAGRDEPVTLLPGRFERRPVMSRIFQGRSRELLYLKVREFYHGAPGRPGTGEQIGVALAAVPHASGILIDLRMNGGGFVDEVGRSLSFFIQKGAAIKNDVNPKKKQLLDQLGIRLESEIRIDPKVHKTDRAVVVLVDPGSASGAEQFAGVIGRSQRGLVVGDRTHGKGTVQVQLALSDRNGLGGMIILTVERFFFFDRSSPQYYGMLPHRELSDPRLRPAVEALRQRGLRVILFEEDYGDRAIPPVNGLQHLPASGVLKHVVDEIASRKDRGEFRQISISSSDGIRDQALEYLDVMVSIQNHWKPPVLPDTLR